jgi:hypothetical protein
MTENNTTGWPKRITVERKIVNLLSRSLYADFPRAIREAVSNSYDADATVVKIYVNTNNREIIVEDNGNGMSVEQFDDYLRIAGRKAEAGLSEKFYRKRIGRFGVGFLASFPFCDNLEITSKREGLEVGFTARIPTRRFVEGKGIEEEEISSIPIDGYNEPLIGKGHEHYTRIRMIGLSNLVDEYFKVRPEAKTISIQSQPGMKRLKWQLCETLSLDFERKYSDIAQILGSKPVGMEVWLNNEKLYRSDPGGQVLASSGQTHIKLGNLEFKYAISTDWKIIHPVEARGLKVRLNGVGIGPRTYFDIEKEVRTFSRLNWLTGEVHIMAGLDESLGLTRDSFIWSPEYETLKDFFHKVLLRVHSQVENVASVEKEVSEAISKKGTMLPVSLEEVVDRSVKQLSNSGFQIIHKKKEEIEHTRSPVIIDKKNRTATIIDDYVTDKNAMEVPRYAGIKIKYGFFEGRRKSMEPVRLADDGTIELNKSYPIFLSKTKGEILRRIHVLLLLAKRECKSTDEMYDYLVKRIREEFE